MRSDFNKQRNMRLAAALVLD